MVPVFLETTTYIFDLFHFSPKTREPPGAASFIFKRSSSAANSLLTLKESTEDAEWDLSLTLQGFLLPEKVHPSNIQQYCGKSAMFCWLDILLNQYFASTTSSQPCNPVSKATALLFTAVGTTESPFITAVGHPKDGLSTCGHKDLGSQRLNLKITQNNAKITLRSVP